MFQQKVLPFGSVASVTAFLRVAHGIWKLGSKLLKLMWTSYFDDFFSITDASSARHTDLVVLAMFNLLGWKLSADKLIDYHTVCKVLGVEFDFNMSGAGLTTVNNTADRVKELCDQLDSIPWNCVSSRKVTANDLGGVCNLLVANFSGGVPGTASVCCPSTYLVIASSCAMTPSQP